MKLIPLLYATLAIILSPHARALPVLNLNAPGAEEITLFPDHLDPNLFYIAPTVMLVADAPDGLPLFSYLEFGGVFQQKGAIIQTTLKATFPEADIQATERRILAQNPAARFTGLPFFSSQVVFEDQVLSPLVTDSSCDHPAGLVGDEQACSFRLNERGRTVIRPMLTRGLALTLRLQYSIEGVIQGADGKFAAQTNTYDLAGRIGGPELAKHPELFRGNGGRQLPQ